VISKQKITKIVKLTFSPKTIITSHLPTEILHMAQNISIGCFHCVQYQARGLLGCKATQCGILNLYALHASTSCFVIIQGLH
jgi:hypothetical protein